MQEDKINWFAAKAHFGQEVGIKEKLEKMGVEHFIPTEERTDRSRHALIPDLVFIRDTKQNILNLKATYGLPIDFTFDDSPHTLPVVPDKEMEDFQRVLGKSPEDDSLMDTPPGPGDRVRVKRGILKGVEGNFLELEGRYYIVVGLCGRIYAKARTPKIWLERMP